MPNNNYYQGIASDLSNQGRYGDSMLMHVNPAEVEGLASAFPGRVTINPETGLPEAFAIIPALALGAAIGGVTHFATGSQSPLWQSILLGAAGGALTGGLGSVLGGATAGTAGAAGTVGAAGAASTAVELTAAQLAAKTAEEAALSSALSYTPPPFVGAGGGFSGAGASSSFVAPEVVAASTPLSAISPPPLAVPPPPFSPIGQNLSAVGIGDGLVGAGGGGGGGAGGIGDGIGSPDIFTGAPGQTIPTGGFDPVQSAGIGRGFDTTIQTGGPTGMAGQLQTSGSGGIFDPATQIPRMSAPNAGGWVNPLEPLPGIDPTIGESLSSSFADLNASGQDIFGENYGFTEANIQDFFTSLQPLGAFALPLMFEEEEEIEDVPATTYPRYWTV